MDEYKRIDLLVTIARLYYEYNYSQSMIAEKLNLSRPYISKLLNDAKEAGIVTITVKDPVHSESALERELRQRFDLRKVMVAPASLEETPLAKIGAICARYLNSIVTNGSVIGVGWGKTLYSCAQNLPERQKLEQISVVQLCGAISNLERDIYASEVPKRFASAFGGIPYSMPLPAVMEDVQVKESVLRDRNINQVMELAIKSNIAVFTTGMFGDGNALVRAGYLLDGEMERLKKLGAVGDICCHFIGRKGEICDPDLDQRVIGISLEELRKKDYRIVVAEGANKVGSICAALTGGYANVLATDEPTANLVLNHLDKTK